MRTVRQRLIGYEIQEIFPNEINSGRFRSEVQR